MGRMTLSLVAPPLAVSRHGCASCCAAPIGVFWLAGVASLVYAGLGGPMRSSSVAWSLVALGLALWLTATAWALLTIQSVNDQRSSEKRRSPGRTLREDPQGLDESNPLDALRIRDRKE